MTLVDTLLLPVITTLLAAVAVTAAVGAYRKVTAIYEDVERHERTLYGVENNPEYRGVTARVADLEDHVDSDEDDGPD